MDSRGAAIPLSRCGLGVPHSAGARSILDALGDKPIIFGLRAQGHISTVERLLAKGATWDEIGKEIGWHGATAKRFYEEVENDG